LKRCRPNGTRWPIIATRRSAPAIPFWIDVAMRKHTFECPVTITTLYRIRETGFVKRHDIVFKAVAIRRRKRPEWTDHLLVRSAVRKECAANRPEASDKRHRLSKREVGHICHPRKIAEAVYLKQLSLVSQSDAAVPGHWRTNIAAMNRNLTRA